MARKITFTTSAVALTLALIAMSVSPAMARNGGGRGGNHGGNHTGNRGGNHGHHGSHNFHHNHFHGRNFGWGGYGVEYPAVEYSPTYAEYAPAYAETEVAPVAAEYEVEVAPIASSYDSSYDSGSYWGGHGFRNHRHSGNHFHGHTNHQGGSRGGRGGRGGRR